MLQFGNGRTRAGTKYPTEPHVYIEHLFEGETYVRLKITQSGDIQANLSSR